MFFYKKMNSDGTLNSLQSCSQDLSFCGSDLIPISETEFDEITAVLKMKADEEERLAEEAILAEQERIANLEKENASLLFQLLTGEEYTDV